MRKQGKSRKLINGTAPGRRRSLLSSFCATGGLRPPDRRRPRFAVPQVAIWLPRKRAAAKPGSWVRARRSAPWSSRLRYGASCWIWQRGQSPRIRRSPAAMASRFNHGRCIAWCAVPRVAPVWWPSHPLAAARSRQPRAGPRSAAACGAADPRACIARHHHSLPARASRRQLELLPAELTPGVRTLLSGQKSDEQQEHSGGNPQNTLSRAEFSVVAAPQEQGKSGLKQAESPSFDDYL